MEMRSVHPRCGFFGDSCATWNLGDTSEVYVKGKSLRRDIGKVYLGTAGTPQGESFKDKLSTASDEDSPMGVEKITSRPFEVRVLDPESGGESRQR